jgi:hypothetical protein
MRASRYYGDVAEADDIGREVRRSLREARLRLSADTEDLYRCLAVLQRFETQIIAVELSEVRSVYRVRPDLALYMVLSALCRSASLLVPDSGYAATPMLAEIWIVSRPSEKA